MPQILNRIFEVFSLLQVPEPRMLEEKIFLFIHLTAKLDDVLLKLIVQLRKFFAQMFLKKGFVFFCVKFLILVFKLKHICHELRRVMIH